MLQQVQGFPTLAWVSGKDGSVTIYQGDRSLEDLTAFVNVREGPCSSGAVHPLTLLKALGPLKISKLSPWLLLH